MRPMATDISSLSSLLLGGGALVTAGWGIVTSRQAKKERDEKRPLEIQLSEEQRRQVADEANAQQNEKRIATERWWKEQFDAVRRELTVERRWRRAITKTMRAHAPWDLLVEAKFRELNIEIPVPPPLDVDDFIEDELFGDMHAIESDPDDEKP